MEKISKLENLEPQAVFRFFEEICRIPHGSGNTKQISDYLKQFATDRGLYCRQDEWNNLVVKKPATEGYEDHEPVILQGHMDMVAVQEENCSIDMTSEGLRLKICNDMIMAEGTSLGGDDGIALAFGMALLDDTTCRHPELELIFTVDEETGMDGARNLSTVDIRSKRMINLDQEEEGVFIAGCAGGARVDLNDQLPLTNQKGLLCKLEVAGLLGGHSGNEIHKERGNAICILARLLTDLLEEDSIALLTMQGGVADNAIPTQARAKFLLLHGTESIDEKNQICQTVSGRIQQIFEQIRNEYDEKDEMELRLQMMEETEALACSPKASKRWIAMLNILPHGVISYSTKVKGVVETSLNPGILSLKDGEAHVSISVRSLIDSAKYALIRQLESVGKLAGADVTVRGEYPGWNFVQNSKLRNTMVAIYEQMYGESPKIEVIHAGLECGIFQSSIKGLDCISIGPDMKNIHTTRECLSIPSVAHTWEYLLNVLEKL